MKTLFTSLLFLITTFIFAQDEVRFHVEVPDTVPSGQTFKVSFILDNAQGNGFDVAEWKNFNVVSGPQTSSSFSIINDVSSKEMSFTYYLQAKKEGTFTINPATVFVDGEAIKTDWKKIVVLEGYEPKEKSNNPSSMFREWGSPFGDRPRNRQPEKPIQPKKKKRTNKKTYRI